MNGQQAMARDAAFLRRMAPHMTAEEIERYSWLAGDRLLSDIDHRARAEAEEDAETRVREARGEGFEAGLVAAHDAHEDLFRDQAKPKLAAVAERLRKHTAQYESLIADVESAL